jgi:hypothetical protein
LGGRRIGRGRRAQRDGNCDAGDDGGQRRDGPRQALGRGQVNGLIGGYLERGWSPGAERCVDHRDDCLGIRRTLIGPLGETRERDLLSLRRDGHAGALEDRRRRVVDVHHHGVHGLLALEGGTPAEHFVEEDAERVQVCAVVDRAVSDDLRRHVPWRAQELTAHREVAHVVVEHLGDTKVHDLDRFFFAGGAGQHHVRRLQVTMDDARSMRLSK